VFVDVTEVRRLESLRKDFVANVSHELRTPVTAVRSAIDTLRSSAVTNRDDGARFLEMIDRNAQRLSSLIEDLLDLSRIEAREYHPLAEAVSLPTLVRQVLGLVRERAERKGLTLEVALSDGLPAMRADPRALERVLTNLTDNAVKYCRAGDRITIGARVDRDRLRCWVEDTGPGIEAQHLPRIFERFYRADSGRSREMGGTGLGLSIAKHLVEAMGGTIGVESAPGKGSTFWVALPLAATPAG
jgi:two-component system phosphate regulon sensor histidine kinase PhoR